MHVNCILRLYSERYLSDNVYVISYRWIMDENNGNVTPQFFLAFQTTWSPRDWLINRWINEIERSSSCSAIWRALCIVFTIRFYRSTLLLGKTQEHRWVDKSCIQAIFRLKESAIHRQWEIVVSDAAKLAGNISEDSAEKLSTFKLFCAISSKLQKRMATMA